MTRLFVVGTRASALARAQTAIALRALAEARSGARFGVRTIATTGDRVRDRALPDVGARGAFVRELEDALLRRDIDLAVHSLKDLPLAQPEGLLVAAVGRRADPRDALVGGRLADLPEGGRVGTGSPRRIAQLRRARPDLRFEPIRGNVDTRLRKRREQGFAAVVLAAAGLDRLGLGDEIAERLPPEVCLPEPGQGALAVEIRSDDSEAAEIVSAFHDEETAAAAGAERALLAYFGGGCHLPLGALGRVGDGRIAIGGAVASLDGRNLARGAVEGPVGDPELVPRLGAALEEQGARAWLTSPERTAVEEP